MQQELIAINCFRMFFAHGVFPLLGIEGIRIEMEDF